jgi:hypothetical protein
MRQKDFEELWNSRNKCINETISYVPHRTIPDTWVFDGIDVMNSTENEMVLNGTFHCGTGEIVFNFRVPLVSAFRRYDIGGGIHRDSGRNHVHITRKDNCIARKLPFAIRRDDLRGKTPKEVWQVVCLEADIAHTDTFFGPEVQCRR